MDDKPATTWLTPARDALESWISAKPGRSQMKLSKIVGCHQQAISFWVRGVNRPDMANATALQIVCGIAESDWLTAEERIRLARLRSEVHERREELAAAKADDKE